MEGQTQRAFLPAVARRAIRDDHRGIVVEMRMRHAEGLEDVRFGEGAKRLAAHALDDGGQQEIARVAVGILGPRRGLQCFLTGEQVQKPRGPADPILARRRQLDQKECVAEPAGVGEQVADRERLPYSGKSGMYLRTSSSSESRSRWARSRMLIAVNCLETDAAWNTDAGVMGTPSSRFAAP